MTPDQLAKSICFNCRFLELDVYEDRLGRMRATIIGCRKDAKPFYNEDAECADCDKWEWREG